MSISSISGPLHVASPLAPPPAVLKEEDQKIRNFSKQEIVLHQDDQYAQPELFQFNTNKIVSLSKINLESLNLSKAEQTWVTTLSEHWKNLSNVNSPFCFIQLWGLEVDRQMQELIKVTMSVPKESLISNRNKFKSFHYKLFTYFVFLNSVKNTKKAYSKWLKNKTFPIYGSVTSPEFYSLQLSDINTSVTKITTEYLKNSHSNRIRLKLLREAALIQLQVGLELGKKIILANNALDIFMDRHKAIFNRLKMKDVDKQQPAYSLKELNMLCDFLASASKDNHFSPQAFPSFQKPLQSILLQPKKTLEEMRKLTYQYFTDKLAFHNTIQEYQDKEVESKIKKAIPVALLCDFFSAGYEYLENSVISPIFPNTYVDAEGRITRICKVWTVFSEELEYTRKINFSFKTSNESLSEHLLELRNSLEIDLNVLLKPPAFSESLKLMENFNSGSRHSQIMDLLILRTHITAINIPSQQLEEYQKKHVHDFYNLFLFLTKNGIQGSSPEWIQCFQDLQLQYFKPLIYLECLRHDLDTLFGFKINEEDLDGSSFLSDPLVNFLGLDGLEEQLEKFLADQSLVLQERIAPSAKEPSDPLKIEVDQKVAKAQPRKLPSSARQPVSSPGITPALSALAALKETPELLRQRGQKKRKILASLRSAGFQAVRQNGSHLILQLPGNGRNIVIPVGGSKKHLRKGTAQSIASSVEAAASQAS